MDEATHHEQQRVTSIGRQHSPWGSSTFVPLLVPRTRLLLRLLHDYYIQAAVESMNLRGGVFTWHLPVSCRSGILRIPRAQHERPNPRNLESSLLIHYKPYDPGARPPNRFFIEMNFLRITPCHTTTYHKTSHHVISHEIVSYRITSYHIISPDVT